MRIKNRQGIHGIKDLARRSFEERRIFKEALSSAETPTLPGRYSASREAGEERPVNSHAQSEYAGYDTFQYPAGAREELTNTASTTISRVRDALRGWAGPRVETTVSRMRRLVQAQQQNPGNYTAAPVAGRRRTAGNIRRALVPVSKQIGPAASQKAGNRPLRAERRQHYLEIYPSEGPSKTEMESTANSSSRRGRSVFDRPRILVCELGGASKHVDLKAPGVFRALSANAVEGLGETAYVSNRFSLNPDEENAFRHCDWSCKNYEDLKNRDTAYKLMYVHESCDLTPGERLGSPDSNLDLHNNKVGLWVAENKPGGMSCQDACADELRMAQNLRTNQEQKKQIMIRKAQQARDKERRQKEEMERMARDIRGK